MKLIYKVLNKLQIFYAYDGILLGVYQEQCFTYSFTYDMTLQKKAFNFVHHAELLFKRQQPIT